MPWKVLLVEDDAMLAEFIRLFLESKGFEVLWASDGEDGLKMARDGQPSVILLDLMLPGMTGFEVCRKLKSEKSTRNIPVVVVSSLDKTELVQEALSRGANDYIMKPFDKERLLAKIQKFLVTRSP